MKQIRLKFGPGDTLYTINKNEDNDIVICKGIIEYCYITNGDIVEYACLSWGGEVLEADAYTLKELLKVIPKLLSKIKK